MKAVLAVTLNPGLEIIDLVLKAQDEIPCILVHEDNAVEQVKKIRSDLNVVKVTKETDFAALAKQYDFDFLITVYWPWLLQGSFFKQAKVSTVNFHPAPLPINRGWYPHVHSLLDGSPTGVTLHQIDDGADTGPVWAQKLVPLHPTDTAKDIYDRLKGEMVQLFAESWPKIKNGQVEPRHQDHSKAIYRAKKSIDGLDHIDPEKTYKAKDLINLLRARTFGSKGFAFTEIDGQKVFLNLALSETNSFKK